VLTAPGAVGLDAALPMLVNELAELPVPLTLVFDDYHLVPSQEVLHSVAFLVDTGAGVFVAGDARSESAKRVASAVGEGAMAVMLVHRYLENL
jgi:ATP/maltotriose-dependent transcriptional regulator MalT